MGAKADMESTEDGAASASRSSAAGSGAMSSGAAASRRKKEGARQAVSVTADPATQAVLSRLDHRADAGPGSQNWHELYVPHALDFEWTTESIMDPSEMTMLQARQHKAKKLEAGTSWRHDDVSAGEAAGGADGVDGALAEGGAEVLAYIGPPKYLSGCASAPNDTPLPPFEGYVEVVPRGQGGTASGEVGDGDGGKSLDAADPSRSGEGERIGGEMAKEIKSSSDLHSELEDGADPGSAPDAPEAPEMAFESFPGIFQPQRMEIRPLHPAAARALRIQAGLVLVDLLGLLVKSHLTCRQLSDLVRLVPLSLTALRIEIAVSFFPKVVDLPQFYRVMFALAVQERRAVVHRIGLLNLLDPFHLDGDFELSFRYWDERAVAGMLARLSVSESSRSFRGLGARGTPDFNSI